MRNEGYISRTLKRLALASYITAELILPGCKAKPEVIGEPGNEVKDEAFLQQYFDKVLESTRYANKSGLEVRLYIKIREDKAADETANRLWDGKLEPTQVQEAVDWSNDEVNAKLHPPALPTGPGGP
ncbi:MAG TPA: hypothetical protein VJA47_02085 [archaeon]|nr:hypothetical protein [archaeon]